MKGKNIYFTHNDMMCLLAVLKLWRDSADEELYKFLLDMGLDSAWFKLYDKYAQGTDLKENKIYPDSDSFLEDLFK